MNKIDGRYLKDLRIKNGYSLREFAELIYSSKSSLQRWENSYLPENEEILARIAEVCGLSVEEMREESERLYESSKNIKNSDNNFIYDDDEVLTRQDILDLKFGIKWLPIPIAFLFVLLIILIIV